MKPCTALRGKTACRGRLRIAQCLRRPYSSESSGQPDPAKAGSSPAVTTTTTRGDNIRINHNDKTVETSVGSLPLSPVMDPAFWEARERYKARKPKAARPENAFERQFRKNPFAQALATPMRFEVATKLRLPSFFLQDFKLVAHPETGEPWWLPMNLELAESSTREAAGQGDSSSPTLPDVSVQGMPGEGADLAENTQQGAKVAVPPKKYKALGPAGHLLARQEFIKSVTVPQTFAYRMNSRLLGPSSSSYTNYSRKAVWREDMDEFILEQMRQQVVQSILYFSDLCATRERYYIVKCFGWEDVKFKQKGALLWFGGAGNDGAVPEPGPFATFDVTVDDGSPMGLAVHNMPKLLGPNYARQLQDEAAVLKDGAIFMLAGRRTTDLQMKLWKLQGYIAEF
ncbi:hypothetical protein BX600DRAFT_89482 [Xylariales sp. PMI_506]|nr:hypothetical protein BX600DRAFT_89482 [Xylariales sp. PMI_506]